MEVERAELEKQLEILKARYDAIPKTHEHLVNNGGGISKTVCLDEPRSETSSQNVLTQEQTGWRAENLNNRFRDKPQNVLFVYPRRMSSKEVGVCFDAACSQVLKKNDNLNIIWAGSPIVESSGDSLMISSADVNVSWY